MRSFVQYLTETPKPYAIGIVGNQGGVFGKQLDPGQFNTMHLSLWPNSFSLSKHFRVNRETLVTDEWPTLDDFFSIMDWCEREGYKIKFYQGAVYARPVPIKQFDPRTLIDDFIGLTFAQLLSEATDQKSAFAKLKQLYKANRLHRSGYVDIEAIFGRRAEYPPMQGWNDTVTYRKKVGGVKIQDVPVANLIPTQDGVSVSGVERFIKQNPNRWNDSYEVVRVVMSKGKLYVMDGHHRASAAILMGYPTVPAELQPL